MKFMPSFHVAEKLRISKKTYLPSPDMTMMCCLPERYDQTEENGKRSLQGLALATCCHHLCQWKHYTSNFLFKVHLIYRYTKVCLPLKVTALHE